MGHRVDLGWLSMNKSVFLIPKSVNTFGKIDDNSGKSSANIESPLNILAGPHAFLDRKKQRGTIPWNRGRA